MNEQRGHRLERLLSVFVCAIMLMGLMVLVTDNGKAFPDNATIVGHVTDGVNPVENVYIKAMLFMGEGSDINWTMTDVNGDYAMMVPGGLSYVLFAAHGDYYMIMDSITIMPGETRVMNFTLTHITETADVTVSGYVTDELGDPRWDGHVLGIVNNPMGGDTPYYANVTTPDPVTGYYEVNVIPGPAGGGAVGMDFLGYPMAENGTDAPFLPGMSYAFNLQLMPIVYNDDAMIYGYVTDADSGVPLAGTIVSYELWDGMNDYSNWTLTNDTGYYEMGAHSGDDLRMTFQKIGYTIKFFEIDVPPASMFQQDAQLRMTTAVIRGTVTEAGTGTPIAFARVFLVDDPSMQGNMSMAMTAFNGSYELGAFEGTGLYFGAEADGYARSFIRINVTSGDELWYDFVLQPYNAWLTGQVTNAVNGAPLGGAQVHIMGPTEENQWTDGMGMYNITLVAGDYTIEVNRWGEFKTYLANITTVEGANVLDISLIPWQNALIRGQVYDIISGDPVPWANIWLSGWWGSGTSSNETGYYELYNTDGAYDVYVNAPGYEAYSTSVFLPELSVTELNIGLMPTMPEQTCILHGYVTNSDDSSPVFGAEVRIRLDSGTYENSSWSVPAMGYYEMSVPAWVLNVRVTADNHAPMFGQINLTGMTDYALDVVLDRDPYRPNVTHSQSTMENISSTNPSMIQIAIEEDYLREMTMMFFMELNSSGLDSNWSMIQYMRTSLDPWNWQEDLPYTHVGGTYYVNYTWNAWGLGGWLSNGTEQNYFPATTWPYYSEPAFALSGAYSNSTMPQTQGMGLFNVSSGEFMAFWPYGMGGPIVAPDPTGVFEPIAFVLEFDNGIPINFNWMSMGAYDISTLTFMSVLSFPSGNYITEFYCNDWGNQGDYFLNYVTVDNGLPTADAGPDQNVPTNAIVTLDGTASYDNVGIATYMWEFYNATGVWTVLWGPVVTYSFEFAGSYNVNLTVWDGAGHMSIDALTVHVFLDSPPVADAGSDQMVDEDTVVAFDGSGSTDDNGIVNYTWTVIELAIELYGPGPMFVFADPGVYHVWLVVTDNASQASMPDEAVITVNDLTPPVADAGPDQVVSHGDMVTLDGSASTDNGRIIDYAWSFFDVMPMDLHGRFVNYTFSAPGTYVITLTVQDEGGNWDTDDLTVIVSGRPVADAGPDQVVDEDTNVTFDGSGSWDLDGIDNYTWTVMELAVDLYGVNPTYVFDDPGTYHVWLVVTDTMGQISDPDEMIVDVNDVTAPIPDAGPDQFVNYGSLVTFDGSASFDNGVITEYVWSFFDVMPVDLYGATADYTFNTPGIYQVVLTVTDSAGNSAMDDMWVYVNGPPVAVSPGDQLIYAGDWAYFNGWSCLDDFNAPWEMEYTWRYTYMGSEVVVYGIDAWAQFVIPGEYSVSLTVRDTGGLEDTTSFVVTVVMSPSAWWVDPSTGETLPDGTTIPLDYAILRGYAEEDGEVNIITPTATYQVWANGEGYFELDPLFLSEGLNVVTILTYSDWWGQVVSLTKIIQSDTYCNLMVYTSESPTTDLTAYISGVTEHGATVTVGGVFIPTFPDGTFATSVALSDGPNSILVVATDAVGNVAMVTVDIEVDRSPPSLAVTGPDDGSNVSQPSVLVYGTTDSDATVWVNGAVASDGTMNWSATIALTEGANTITVVAMDALGNVVTESLTVSYVPPIYVTPEQLAALEAELTGMINNLSAAMQENVTDLQAQIDALTSSLAENVTDLQAQIDAAMENITSLQDQIDALVADIAWLQAQIDVLDAALDENVTDLQAQIDAAMAEIAALQAEIDAAVADIAALETSLASNVTALQNQISQANANITDLENALAENVTALNGLIDALANAVDQDVASLQAQIASAEANITALESDLAAETAALQASIDALADDLAAETADLQTQVNDLHDQLVDMNATLTGNMTDLQDQVDQIEQQLQDRMDDVEEQSSDTDAFADMLMYLTLILFAITIALIGVVWYLMSNKMKGGNPPAPPESLEEVEEPPTDVEKEFEKLEKEIKNEEL